MKKKVLSLFLAGMIAATGVVGCGNTENKNYEMLKAAYEETMSRTGEESEFSQESKAVS